MSNWGNRNKKSKLAVYLEEIFAFLIFVIPILVALGLVGVLISCVIVYGGKPVSELPSWVAWLMFRG